MDYLVVMGTVIYCALVFAMCVMFIMLFPNAQIVKLLSLLMRNQQHGLFEMSSKVCRILT